MSVKLMSAIFETEFRDMQDEKGNVTKAATAKLVLLALADHANDEGESAYPSIERLSRKTALAPQTIRNTFDSLRHNGVIFLEGVSKLRTNNYTINTKSFPRLVGKDDGILTLQPLEGQMGDVEPSNQSLLTLQPLEPNHSLTTNQPSESLLTASDEKEIVTFFTEKFGFLSEYQAMTKTERTRLLVLASQVGKETIKEIMAWAAKKEIHLSNRSGLLDSLETAAGDWRKKVKYPKREEKTVRVSPEEIIRRYVLEHPTV